MKMVISPEFNNAKNNSINSNLQKLLTIRSLGITAYVAIFIGAIGSIDLMLRAGKNNHSILLIMMVAVWVLSPFITLLILNRISYQWASNRRLVLYLSTLIISFISVLIYSNLFPLHFEKTAFKYLVFPLVSWLIIIAVMLKIKSVRKG